MTINDLRIKLKTMVTGIIDKELMDEVGAEIVSTVKSRTRKGFGVKEEGGPQTRLKGLSESYKKQRIRLKAQGRLSPEATINKSNLTKSGDMIESIDHISDKNSTTIAPVGDDNKKKAEYQASAGRIAFNLSKSEKRKILKLIDQKIKKDIKKNGL